MRQRRLMSRIKVVPDSDVMLVVLVIFMVTAPMMPSGTVDLPSVAKASQAKQAPMEIIVKETTSIGVRFFPVSRMACDRVITTVCIDGRELHCKVCRYGGQIVNISAEYDDCRAAAEATGIPLKEWQRKVKEAAYRQFTE